MTLFGIGKKARSAILAGLAALSATTFQNGCNMNVSGDLADSFMDGFSSGYYGYDYSDSYGGWDSGWDTGSDYNHGSNLDWDLLDVKSG
jgi:hypothetical protein